MRYYYDDNGNMTAKQKTTKGSMSATRSSRMALSGRSTDAGLEIYRYDAFNRLTNYNSGSVEASYTYNANNLRASKTVNRERTDFVWNGQNLASETKSGTTTSYTYDPTGVILSNNGTDTTRFIKDPHGNVVATSKNDSIIGTYDYTAFGNQLENTDSSNPFRYCGEYYDSESGLIYLRNRYYDSSTGRFINEDPIKDGLNWYSYCSNNPVMFYDPSGFGIIDDTLKKEYDNISYYEGRISSLDLTKYEDEELSYRYQDEIETSKSTIKNILDNTTILEVPAFCQNNTINGGELCWACSESMIIAYLKGDCIDRTYDIAKDANDFTSRKWYSCETKFGVESLGIKQNSGKLTEQEIRKMIDKCYPIPIRYGSGRNSGHFVVITGYSIINNETIIVYNDPATGEKYEKTYQAFKSYYDDGSMPWTHTVTNWYKLKE